MAGNQDQKGRKNPGISMITRKEQHFTDNPTRLHPAILRVEEKVKKTNPELSRIHAARTHRQLTLLTSELVISPLASLTPRNKAKRPEVSTHLVKPYASHRWGPLRRASPGTPGEESAGRGSSQAVQLQVPKQGLLWKASVPFPPLQPPLLCSRL